MDLQTLIARAEISDVLTRYTRAIDFDEWDLLDTVFTPDAAINYVESGGIEASYPEVKPWLMEMLPAFFPRRMHQLVQIDIEFGEPADTATVAAYFYNPMPADDGHGGGKIVEIGGVYRHQMVLTPDGWRSRGLHEQVIWKRGL